MTPLTTMEELARRVLEGDARAVAQAMTLIENGDGRGRDILKRLYPETGRAHVVGVTGAAGSGKSALIDRLAAELRRRHNKIGILMVDPTSPFTGGAFLGDRLRMRDHFLDDGVFIRSLASRAGSGGISNSVREAVHLLDAMGKQIVFVETIGAGQDQVEIASVAHTVLLVLSPWTGDEIQGMKAGVLEAADILVVNKADLSGAEELFQQLRALFDEAKLPVLRTSALAGEGIAPLAEELERHRSALLASGDHRKKNASFSRRQLLSLVQQELMARFLANLDAERMEALVERVAARELDPYTAAEEILEGEVKSKK